jgi:integrase
LIIRKTVKAAELAVPHCEHAPLKTQAGRREVILAPALANSLRERWLASRYKAPRDFVFCNTLGRGLDYRDVGEGFRQAVRRSGLQAPGKLTLHSLRHTFASLLIARRLDVVFVSRQLGHANPSITLGVYAHL